MNRSVLTAAVASAIVASGYAQAQGPVTPADTGFLLLIPYYTTESGNETYINVVNTSDDFKALKVRFREARGSEDSLDFHVYLSPRDVWAAALTQNANGVPTLVTANRSCTWGRVGSTATTSRARVQTTYLDQIITRLDEDVYQGGDPNQRIREGYVEIIEMATLADYRSAASGDQPDFLSFYAKHVDGVPRDCNVFRTLNTDPATRALRPDNYGGSFQTSWMGTTRTIDVADQFEARTGGLFASAALINVEDATYIPMEVTTLRDNGANSAPMFFSQSDRSSAVLADYTADRGLVFVKGALQYWDLPDLSTRVDSVTDGFSAGDVLGQIGAVTDALLANRLTNEFLVDSALGASTDWVVTLPTKRYHVAGAFGSADGVVTEPVIPPFTQPYNYADALSCERIGVAVYDREERPFSPPTTPSSGFSPGIPDAPEATSLCWEANVFAVSPGLGGEPAGASAVLGATQTLGVLPVGDFSAGWIQLTLDEQGRDGLPVIGFAAWQFINDGQTATGSLNQYGGGFRHRLSAPVLD